MLETLNPNVFAADEWFSVAGADAPTPIPRAIANVVQRRGEFVRPARDELALVTADGLHFGLDLIADVDDERRFGMDSQVNAEVVEKFRRPIGISA